MPCSRFHLYFLFLIVCFFCFFQRKISFWDPTDISKGANKALPLTHPINVTEKLWALQPNFLSFGVTTLLWRLLSLVQSLKHLYFSPAMQWIESVDIYTSIFFLSQESTSWTAQLSGFPYSAGSGTQFVLPKTRNTGNKSSWEWFQGHSTAAIWKHWEHERYSHLPLGGSASSFFQRTVGCGSPCTWHRKSTASSSSTTWLIGRLRNVGRSRKETSEFLSESQGWHENFWLLSIFLFTDSRKAERRAELREFRQVELMMCISSQDNDSRAGDAATVTSGPHVKAKCHQHEARASPNCLPVTPPGTSSRPCPSAWIFWLCTAARMECDLRAAVCSSNIRAASGDSLPSAIINTWMLRRKT